MAVPVAEVREGQGTGKHSQELQPMSCILPVCSQMLMLELSVVCDSTHAENHAERGKIIS